MLTKIFIQNFALIHHLELNLDTGLHIITGETGAGKSILLGALRLLMGAKADNKIFTPQKIKSIVEAEFEMPNYMKDFFDENDLDWEDRTLIRREIQPGGRSRGFINDSPVSLDILRRVSEQLIDIHSQFETSQLFSQNYQFHLLDNLADNNTLLTEYQQHFTTWQKLQKQLSNLENQLANSSKERDYKNFLLEELNRINIDAEDWYKLEYRLKQQQNAEQIIEDLGFCSQIFNNENISLLSLISQASNKLEKMIQIAPEYEEFYQRLESIRIEAQDLSQDIESSISRIEMDPNELLRLQEQHDFIQLLLRKHQALNFETLIEMREKLASDLDSTEELEAQISKISEKIIHSNEKIIKIGKKISEKRHSQAPKLIKKIEAILKRLGLEKAKFEVELHPSETPHSLGMENIQLTFQANSGFPMLPIQQAISGGERSRVMLAIKKITSENTLLPTLILDEIDTGVSGRIAGEIGRLMYEMGKDMQLITITHLPQVAAYADKHYRVEKKDVNGSTQSNITQLTPEQSLREVATLLSGSNLTQAALEQAKELINSK